MHFRVLSDLLVSVPKENPTSITGAALALLLLTMWLPAYISISPFNMNHLLRQFLRFPILVI
jgi:hypothetical protein